MEGGFTGSLAHWLVLLVCWRRLQDWSRPWERDLTGLQSPDTLQLGKEPGSTGNGPIETQRFSCKRDGAVEGKWTDAPAPNQTTHYVGTGSTEYWRHCVAVPLSILYLGITWRMGEEEEEEKRRRRGGEERRDG